MQQNEKQKDKKHTRKEKQRSRVAVVQGWQSLAKMAIIRERKSGHQLQKSHVMRTHNMQSLPQLQNSHLMKTHNMQSLPQQ